MSKIISILISAITKNAPSFLFTVAKKLFIRDELDYIIKKSKSKQELFVSCAVYALERVLTEKKDQLVQEKKIPVYESKQETESELSDDPAANKNTVDNLA